MLVVERFDGAGARRLGYVSAMTMLEADDGDDGSYLDIAAVIEDTRRPRGRTCANCGAASRFRS